MGAAALVVFLAGCGATHGQHPISHGMSPAQVKQEVLARLKNWHAVNETITEVAYGPHGRRHVYNVKLLSQTSPVLFRLDVAPQGGTPFEVVDNGLNTVVYQNGAKHYSVLTADPQSWTEFRVLGTELPGIIQESHAEQVTVNAKEVILHLVSPVAAGISAKTTLWFSLTTNTPIRWQAAWKNGSLEETPKSVHLNPPINTSTFQFTPPSGVTPEVAMTAQGTELDLARSQVSFPIVLPPPSMNLELNGVNVSTRGKSQVVLLTYQTTNGSPAVLTESTSSTFKPPAGMSVVTETVGLLSVKVGALPSGSEMAAFTLHKTLVVAEGSVNVVDALVNAWGTSTSPSPSSP
jgi:outer membrane lipoprotein-sorting protein